jgi:hypothetical protein
VNGYQTYYEVFGRKALAPSSPVSRPSLREQWVAVCIDFARTPSATYASDRKILVGRVVEFDGLPTDLTVEDAGYTAKKAGDLVRLYLHRESRDSALREWRERTRWGRRKPFTVGFHTYNHLMKSEERHGVGSKIGPCMQAVTVASIGGGVRVDVYYRSVEFFRAFAADLAFLRDELLAPFEVVRRRPLVRCHFASVTCHPRDFPIALCSTRTPLVEMMLLRRRDARFHDRVVRWLRYYLDDGSGIANYDRGMRGRDAVLRLMSPDDLDDLREYVAERAS